MSGLLATKLHRPAAPAKRVSRPHLIQRLNAGLDAGRSLTLVSAPAGFGKTTCVGEWLTGLALPVAWLSLDPEDDDPGRFFTYLIAALQTVDSRVGVQIAGVLRSGQLPPGDILSATLVDDLLAVDRQFLLVLDDFQIIQDSFTLHVIEKLVTSPPPALHLVLLTREDPPLPLARLRANNRLTEIRAPDLRFSRQDAACFLNDVMGLDLSSEHIAGLDERIEGWVVGLQLAGLALQAASPRGRPGSAGEFIARLSGSHRYFLSYLTEEVLNRQPDDVRRFLLQTSILDRLSGDLCDAVTQGTGSHALLERLFADNLFLIALDDEGRWYRYHHLFADLLRELQSTPQKEETKELHRRAAGWYAQTGLASEAIQHALSAGDYGLVVHLIEVHAMDMLLQWHVKTVSGWMNAIPAEWIAESPQANLAFAWLHMIRANFAQAAPYLERLYALFSAPGAERQIAPVLQARWLALQSMLLTAQGNAADSLALGLRALEIDPEADIFGRSQVYLGLAGAYQQLDDYPHTVDAYQKIIHLGRAAGNSIAEMLGVSALALLYIQRGRLHLAFDLVSQAVAKIESANSLPPISTALYGELAAIHYDWFQMEQAHRYYQRAIQVSTLSGYADAEMYYSVVLSHLHQMTGDPQAAAREIQKAVALMQVESPVAVREEVIAQQVRIALAQGDLFKAEAALASHGFAFEERFISPALHPEHLISIASREDITRPSGLLFLSAVRILLYRAGARGEKDALEVGIALASTLIAEMLPREYVPFVIQTLLIRSQLYAALGNGIQQQADIVHALKLAEPEGMISVFVEEGAPVAVTLRRLLNQDLSRQALIQKTQPGPVPFAFIQTILDAFSHTYPPGFAPEGKTSAPATAIRKTFSIGEPGGRIEPLTEREREVLGGMAEGLTYSEIAVRLFISLNTVRSHVKTLYAKLNVDNRTKAIDVARQLGLL